MLVPAEGFYSLLAWKLEPHLMLYFISATKCLTYDTTMKTDNTCE